MHSMDYGTFVVEGARPGAVEILRKVDLGSLGAVTPEAGTALPVL